MPTIFCHARVSSQRTGRLTAAITLLLGALCVPPAEAIGSSLTYQGHLQSGGVAADGAYDLQFLLQDTTGLVVGIPIVANDVAVVNGVFTVLLDFGATAFDGSDRFLQMQVRDGASTGAFTALIPRSRITAAPYAQVAESAGFADTVANDSISSTRIVDGSVGASDIDSATVQRRVAGACPAGSAIQSVAAGGSVTCEAGLQGPTGATGAPGAPGSADAWGRLGNAGTDPLLNFLGTTDAQPFELRVANQRIARFESNSLTIGSTSNVLFGSPANVIDAGVRGAVIGGGGVPAGNTDPNFADESPNRISDAYGVIAGGFGNQAGDVAGTAIDAAFASVGGGRRNVASDTYATVGGGSSSIASSLASTIAGGTSNTASAPYAAIGGGLFNSASGPYSVVAGGSNNSASQQFSSVGGGFGNLASGLSATIVGGSDNRASAEHGSVAGGQDNYASGVYASVAGGAFNSAFGMFSTSSGGESNCAGGAYSWVGGRGAQVRRPLGSAFEAGGSGCTGVANALDGDGDNGSFVWADSTNADFTSNGQNQFRVRATGGFTFYTAVDGTGDPTIGARLASGASAWSTLSDRNAKTAIVPVDATGVLASVLALPIATWQYKGQTAAIRHMGPMAQDFRAAFGLGEDDLTISTIDPDGVALAAIQGLNAKLEIENAAQDAELAELRRDLAALRARLDAGAR